MNRKRPMRAGEVIRYAARDLRYNQTAAEEALWERLRDRRLSGYKFRRQHPVRAFVLDFFCAEARLGIEVDGSIHEDSDVSRRDTEREEALAEEGIRLIRFTNEEVLRNIDEVSDRIAVALRG